MPELFHDQPFYEFPSILNACYAMVWAFILSFIIGLVHKYTYSGEYYPKPLFQALILGAIATTMIMMAVGDSLARGLGVFGAMSVIRFQSRIDNTRDILFLFASLGVGIGLGVYGFTVSFVGALSFSIIALLLYQTPLRIISYHHELSFKSSSSDIDLVEQIIGQYTLDYKIIEASQNKRNEWTHRIALCYRKEKDQIMLMQHLQLIENIQQLKIIFHSSTL